jgi:putative hydrolase of the HAD superfamily
LEELVWGGERGRLAQVGQISEVDQWRYACRQLGWQEEQEGELKRKFFAGDILDEELVEFIRGVHLKYHTGVISNAMDGARHFLVHQLDLGAIFDSLVYSYEVGVMKPDERIFQFALASLQVPAAEAVFIDDFEHNVAGARAVGMQAILFRSPQQVISDLSQILSFEF